MKNLFLFTLLFALGISCTNPVFTDDDTDILTSSILTIDLTGQNLSIVDTTLVVGTSTAFSVEVASNSGAARSYLAYYLSKDTTVVSGIGAGSACNGGGCLIPSHPISTSAQTTDKCYSNPLSYESSSIYISPYSFGDGKAFPLGEYYLLAVVDYRQTVTESNESNNVEWIKVNVVAQ